MKANSSFKSTKPLELILSDVWGSLKLNSNGGFLMALSNEIQI